MKKIIIDIVFFYVYFLTASAFIVESYLVAALLSYALLWCYVFYCGQKKNTRFLAIATSILFVVFLALWLVDLINGVCVCFAFFFALLALVSLIPLTQKDLDKIKPQKGWFWGGF